MANCGVVVHFDVEPDREYPAHEFGSVGDVAHKRVAGVLDRGVGHVGGGVADRCV